MYKKEFFEKRTTDKVWSEVSMFSERLRTLRRRKGETQESAADKMGIPKATYGTYENGKYFPDAEKIAKMADYYNVSADYLLGLVETPFHENDPCISDFSRECRDVLLYISKTKREKRAFEYIVNNIQFKKLLEYINTYLLFSRYISRNEDPVIREAYDEISKIDISSTKHLPEEVCLDEEIRISDIYLGLALETLRGLLDQVPRENAWKYSEQIRQMISNEISEK